jgi:hypothetical protein
VGACSGASINFYFVGSRVRVDPSDELPDRAEEGDARSMQNFSPNRSRRIIALDALSRRCSNDLAGWPACGLVEECRGRTGDLSGLSWVPNR